jgi:hypothetical protein
MWRLAYIGPLLVGLLFGQVDTSVPNYPDRVEQTVVAEEGIPPTIRDIAKTWFLIEVDGYYDEWKCMDKIIYAESRWIPDLWNSQGSEAYGLGQVKGSYDYTAGKPLKQFKVAVKYVIARYGTPCKGWSFHQKMGWY